ncbi:RQC domain-containing protein [Desulfosporosinus youngiae]|uniref:Superfamily II DNA helicase n=1 Tax=Desulfosporosinus youngiae DSM 17734 TaxID=768710 RepID=H5Y281_9FIRM|nr:RQC-minor-1 family DNA-binding protein [Desulfosporosinus youngiae]EHQ88429.1 superfamily II DNA helicase [Desulfosporosinus youngiae DSM 17734]
MSRKKQRVRYDLDSGDIRSLTIEEIKVILRAADELIATGGRSMLAKILKGSKDKKVLEHGLDLCPVYGYYRELTLQDITHRIDWMIMKGYLEIEYTGRLPVIVFSKIGWEIERETYAEELLQTFERLLEGKDYSFVQELKDRNRGMIILFLEKIKQTGNARYVPILKVWKEIEYKKMKAEIQRVIDYLVKEGTIF